MIGKKAIILEMLKGNMGDRFYARAHPNPELLILQQRPDRSLRRGQHRKPEQVKTFDALRRAKERAKEIYHTPELRAEWEARYNELEVQCKKKGSRAINGGSQMKKSGGYDLPYHLWPWIYKMCLLEAYREDKGETMG